MSLVTPPPTQLDLFAAITTAYTDSTGSLHNSELYGRVAALAGLREEDLDALTPIGKAGTPRSPLKRKIRWFQQSLKAMGVLERVEGERGIWRLTEKAGKDIDRPLAGVKMVAFSTELGVAIWGRHQDVFGGLLEPIALCITSAPYPLRKARAYGNPPADTSYSDFICQALEPIVKNLLPGGSVVINVPNDVFEDRLPSRALHLERLVLALNDRLGLSLMDRIPWENQSKPPGPTYWACVNRYQLSSCFEHLLWFTNDPARVRADNRRVLEQHTEKHVRLMQRGGEARTSSYGDGAYALHPGSFGRLTSGKIPRNILKRGHSCADTIAYRKCAAALRLPIHGAMQPTSIADFFIRFLSEPGDLIVDPFGGTVRTGLAAERLGRRWLVTEWILQYLRGATGLFRNSAAFQMHPAMYSVGGT